MKSAKENGGASAFPHDQFPGLKGLTKREYFAAMAMQGILSSYDYTLDEANKEQPLADKIAKASLKMADALLKELETPE